MVNSDSILDTIKDTLAANTGDAYEAELLLHINSAIATLNQNGVGAEIVVKDKTSKWTDLRTPMTNYMFEQIKLYIHVKTKILFDPPPPSSIKYMNDAADEILWRLREGVERRND